MTVTQPDIERAIEELGLTGLPVCIHASLGSFGYVEGGAEAVLDAFLAAGCTVVAPTFDYANESPPPPGIEIARNGWGNLHGAGTGNPDARPYDPASNTLSATDMGAISTALLQRPERVRGNHAIDSFSALGPLADDLIAPQSPRNVYAPLREIGARDGYVVLMGVGLDCMTLIHTAEQDAGRKLFRRWTLDRYGEPVETLVGGCSLGFPNLEPALGPLARTACVGASHWRAFPVSQTLGTAAAAIAANPQITHCGNPYSWTCNDAVLGGPIVPD